MTTYKSIIFAALMVASFVPAQASEDYTGGTDYLTTCSRYYVPMLSEICYAFTAGYMQDWDHGRPDEKVVGAAYCLPDSATLPQISNIAVKYIEKNPATEHDYNRQFNF